MSLLCLPATALGALLFSRDLDATDAFAARRAFAALAGVFYCVALRYSGRRGVAAILTALLLLATPNVWYGPGGTNSHTGVQILVVLALWLLLRAREAPAHPERWAAASAVPLAVACLTRPTAAILAVACGLYVLAVHRRAFPAFAAIGATFPALFFAYSYGTYGSALPPYYQAGRLTLATWPAAFATQTLSPNRGLLFLTPVFLYSVRAAWRASQDGGAFERLLAWTPIPFACVVAAFPLYIGGWGFGARFYLDVAPLLVLLLADDAAALGVRGRGAHTAVFVALASAAVFIHSRSLSPDVFRWNWDPVNIGDHPERAWDLRDPQFLRGLAPPFG